MTLRQLDQRRFERFSNLSMLDKMTQPLVHEAYHASIAALFANSGMHAHSTWDTEIADPDACRKLFKFENMDPL